MDIEKLKILVAQDENENVEFKESTNSRSLKEAGETLCGFLNNSGGILLFGVTPRKKINGQEVSEKTKRDIAENVLKHFEPHPPISIKYIDFGDKKFVISLHANIEQAEPPYYFNKVPYYRSQSNTVIMPISMQQELFDLKKGNIKSWETMPAIGMSTNDLDHDEIMHTIQDGISHNRIPSDVKTNNVKEALKRLELINNDQINNAAAILFAKQPSLNYPQCLLRLARFRGKDKKEFIDNQQIYAHGFKILRSVEDFCLRHLPIASYFVDTSMQRVDEPFLPPKAIREAVINAITHRDYRIQAGAINFAIYDDRVEIDSYGELPKKIAISELKKQHNSYPRNRKIANVFFRRGMIEQWGRGTQQIVEFCLSAGHPEPEYIQERGILTVRMYSKHPMETRRKISRHELLAYLDPRQMNILALLSLNPQGLPTGEVVKKLGEAETARRTILRELKLLEMKGLIATKGKGKNTVWTCLMVLE